MDWISEINKLRKEKNAIILAHNYQIPDIQDLGDFSGDSLELARKATETDADMIVMCGVDFMAETAKILNPEKKVLIPSMQSNCPMAGMLSRQELLEAKAQHPEAEVVLYVNSSADCKALADCCCTSANADKVVNAMESDVVIFGPDRNLAEYVMKRTEKKVIPVPEKGHCYSHTQITLEEVQKTMKAHPDAELVVHPECFPEVQDIANAIASTSGMVRYCKGSSAKEFIIGTECGMLHRLEKENPDKKFYPAFDEAICLQMKEITLEKLYNSLKNDQFEVKIPEDISEKAIKAINRMLELT